MSATTITRWLVSTLVLVAIALVGAWHGHVWALAALLAVLGLVAVLGGSSHRGPGSPPDPDPPA